jgi:phosphoribosylglycinamide formyltransferase-1
VKSTVILISGRGSNMEALAGAGLPGRVSAVISNRPDAAGLRFAAERGIATAVVDHERYPAREEFEAALVETIERHRPDLVALAGFMRVFTGGFARRYEGRMLNVHPSLLPAFQGLHTHRRALEQGVKLHGCTVHFVTAALDHGPIVIQAAVPVRPGDTEASLAARVLRQEHRVYPLAARWFLEGRLVIEDGVVRVAGENSGQTLWSED